jgi:RHS repeat-associated protein
VRLLTNNSGAITDRYTYDAFGNLQSSSGSTINPYLYTGQQFDSLTGLYSLRARSYDPTNGRFLSRDTAEPTMIPGDLNRYSYVDNNPVNFTDPSGHGPTPPPLLLPPPAGSTLQEYAGLILAIAISNIPVTGAIATATDCLYMQVVSILMAINYDRLGLLTLNRIDPGAPPPCHIPVEEYPSWETPMVAHHIEDAQNGGGDPRGQRPMLLSYIGAGNVALRRANRRAACGNYPLPNWRTNPGPPNPAQPGVHEFWSCDEYPFATTYQGATDASRRAVPQWEQDLQGNIVLDFYRANLWPLPPYPFIGLRWTPKSRH